MKVLIFAFIFLYGLLSYGSQFYISESRVQEALESIPELGFNPGVGEKNNSCLLCHATASGGPENINSSFGSDFRSAAETLGYSLSGAHLPVTGSPSLVEIFSQASFLSLDSDGDGISNEDEFNRNSDPADDITGSTSGGGSSGGCGMISGGNSPPGSGPWLMLLPFILLLIPRQTRVSRVQF